VAGTLASFLIYERFRNIDNIALVRCPTFLIHGQKDSLIPSSHSSELHSRCGGPCSLLLSNDMDHNEFDFQDDLSQPFEFFLVQCNITTQTSTPDKGQLNFPEELSNVDPIFDELQPRSPWMKCLQVLM